MLKVSSGLQTDNMGLTNRSYLPLANDKCSRANKYNCFFQTFSNNFKERLQFKWIKHLSFVMQNGARIIY